MDAILLSVVCFATLVLVPRTLPVLRGPLQHGIPIFAGARWITAALIVCAMPLMGLWWKAVIPVWLATALTIPWLAAMSLASVEALARLVWPMGQGVAEPRWVAGMRLAAIGYGWVGACWLLAWAADMSVLGFSGIQNLLTAVHFHYAGFGACAAAALLWRHVRPAEKLLFTVTCTLLVTGIASVAVGITVAEHYSVRWPEIGSAWLTSGAVWALAGFLLRISGRVPGTWRSWALTISAMCGLLAGTMSAWYSLRGFQALDEGLLNLMVRVHGLVHAFGFVGLALLALPWPVGTSHPATLLPFSRLAAGARVGPEWFTRKGLLDDQKTASGLTDHFGDYASATLPAGDIHAEVAHFYDRTAYTQLRVVARWHGWLAWGGRIWAAMARRTGQLALPLDTDRPEQIRSQIVPLRDAADGRLGVRGWVRTRMTERGEEAIYVAAYATQQCEGRPYMNIAFPLPGGTMTSVLRVDATSGTRPDKPDGVLLTTLPDAAEPRGQQGVFAVIPARRKVIRLPLDETIVVWPAPAENWKSSFRFGEQFPNDPPTLLAVHDMWIFGWPYLRLEYWIRTDAGK